MSHTKTCACVPNTMRAMLKNASVDNYFNFVHIAVTYHCKVLIMCSVDKNSQAVENESLFYSKVLA